MANYLVIDLEGTCCADDSIPLCEREIIELGAVMVDASLMKVLDEYDEFVNPICHPILTDFCIRLTGIRQKDVDHADNFPVVFDRFCRWYTKHKVSSFYSWGTYDRDQFKKDCNRHRIKYPFDGHVDLSRVFKEKYSRKCGCNRAMKYLGLETIGRQHRGIVDARNRASMLPLLLGNKNK